MSDDEKPVVVPPIIPQATDELVKALEEYRRNVPFLIEYQKLQARVTHEKFLSLVDSGFTVKEAIELCKEWST